MRSSVTVILASLVLGSVAHGPARATEGAPRSIAALHAMDDGFWSVVGAPGAGNVLREDADAVYDSIGDRIVLYGGYEYSQGCLSGESFELPLHGSSTSWRFLTIGGVPPSPRSRHTMTLDPVGDRVIMYGGLIECGSALAGDVWEMSLARSAPIWTPLSPSGVAPNPREGHSSIYDPVRRRVVVFGGFDGAISNETWALNLEGGEHWEKLVPAGMPPPPRWRHRAIYDPAGDCMIVFGGDPFDANVYKLQLSPVLEWSMLPVSGPALFRRGHVAIYDGPRHRMVVMGGQDAAGDHADIWTLSLTGTPTWSSVSVAGASPTARANHVGVYDPVRDRLIVHGGAVRLADTWSLALLDPPSWTSLVLPLPRGDLTWSAYDSIRNRMWIGLATYGVPHDRIFGFDFDGTSSWTEIVPGGSEPPTRLGVSAVYDPVRDRIALFGGSGDNENSSPTDQLWFLWLSDAPFWQAAAAGGPWPHGRRHHAAVYDPLRDRMLVIGGLGGYVDAGSCTSVFRLASPFWPHDTWSFSMTDSMWSRLGDDFEFYGHNAVYDMTQDRILAFGGVHEATFCGVGDEPPKTLFQSSSAIWQFALSTGGAWSPLDATGGPPTPRSGAAAIYDPGHERMVIFGGLELNGVGVSSSVFHNDVWALDLPGGPVWRALFPSGSSPDPREGSEAVFEPGAGRMWIFGGERPGYGFTDLWTLTWDAPTPARISVESADVVASVARIIWQVGDDGAGLLVVYRTDDGAAWREVARPIPDDRGRITFEDRGLPAGTRLGYRLGVRWSNSESFSETVWLETRNENVFSLGPVTPNPSGDRLTVVVTLPEATRTRIEVHDVQGRLVLTQDLSGLGPGAHRVDVASRSTLPPGIYLLRAVCRSEVLQRRAIVVR